jgi:hypothetical protein
MDENERARREEIEAKEKRLYDKIDETRKGLKEDISEAKKDAKDDLSDEADKREAADRRIYQKIDAEKDAMISRMDKEIKHLRGSLETLEEKLEARDREIEKHSQERDQDHDKTLATMKQALDEHLKNTKIHKKLHSVESISEMNRQENLPPPTYMNRRAPEPEPEPADPAQMTADQYAKLGVPWYFNPKWIAGILAALAGGAAAFYVVLKQFGGG